MKRLLIFFMAVIPMLTFAHPLQDVRVVALDSQQSISVKNYAQGKPLYIEMWATWCSPCMKQMPALQKHYREFGEDIAFLAVNIDLNDDAEAIQKVVDKFGLTVPMAQDTENSLATTMQLNGTPLHLVFNRKGDLGYRTHETDEQLETVLTQLKQGVELAAIAPTQTKAYDYQFDTDIVLFSATWCETYWATRNPKAAQECQQARMQVNDMLRQGKSVTVVVSNLWTSEQDATAYKGEFADEVTMVIDENGKLFKRHGIKSIPRILTLDSELR
ncbi:TlpA family protein disulfide reductase [Pseudoalteromonas pernae]|uniref:TlpA family protein disulfide reductase n=1 Tax=Pseudoalteromonas pernae TaxID=3118054 RepID=UPI003242F275